MICLISQKAWKARASAMSLGGSSNIVHDPAHGEVTDLTKEGNCVMMTNEFKLRIDILKEQEEEVEIKRPLQLILIRHAQSARNKAKGTAIYFSDEDARKTVKGIPDHMIPLTEEGLEQARVTGIYLRQRFGVPDYFYHSGYARTILTLEKILGAFPKEEQEQIKVRINLFLRERDPGYTYDMTTEEAETTFPWMREYWQTFGGFFSRPVGGESLADVAQRTYTFINMLFRDRAGKKIWVVVHGGTLRSLRFLLERWTYEQALHWAPGQSPENCGITVYNFDVDQKHLVLQEYNTVCWQTNGSV